MARENFNSNAPKDAPIHPETRLPMPSLYTGKQNLPPDVYGRYPAPHAVSKHRPPRSISGLKPIPFFWSDPPVVQKGKDEDVISSASDAYRLR